MTTSTFVKSIVDQMDETMRQIDEACEHVLGLTARARNLAALAKRYVAEGEADQRADERATAAAQRLDQEIEAEMQRAIERGEQRAEDAGAMFAPSYEVDQSEHLKHREVSLVAGPMTEGILSGVGVMLGGESADKVAMFKGKPITNRDELIARKREADALGANLTPREASGPLGSAFSVFADGIAGVLKSTDDLHTTYDAVHTASCEPVGNGSPGLRDDECVLVPIGTSDPLPASEGSVRFIVGIDPGGQENAGFLVPDLEARERGEEKWIDAGQLLAESFIEIENLPPSPGGDETEAASVAPQPEEPASVEPFPQPRRRDGEEPCGECHVEPGETCDVCGAAHNIPLASAAEAAEPEAGREEASTTADDRVEAEPTAEPAPPAPQDENTGESGDLIAPQFGRQSGAPKPKALNHLYEEVLTLWSTTDLTENQIAKRCAATLSLVRSYLEQARVDGDDRIDARHKGRLKERRNVKAAVAPKEEEQMPPVTGKSAEPLRMPFTKSRDVEIGEFNPDPDSITSEISTGVCVVDLRRHKIIGLKGMWTATPDICRVIAFLNKGEMFAVEHIAHQCGWDKDSLARHRTSIMERLRDIGVQLTDVPGIGWRMTKAA